MQQLLTCTVKTPKLLLFARVLRMTVSHAVLRSELADNSLCTSKQEPLIGNCKLALEALDILYLRKCVWRAGCPQPTSYGHGINTSSKIVISRLLDKKLVWRALTTCQTHRPFCSDPGKGQNRPVKRPLFTEPEYAPF